MLCVKVDVNENQESKEQRPHRQWKRKTYSSAAETLTFLQTYTEKREEAEEEKLNPLREMKDKKSSVLANFFKY